MLFRKPEANGAAVISCGSAKADAAPAQLTGSQSDYAGCQQRVLIFLALGSERTSSSRVRELDLRLLSWDTVRGIQEVPAGSRVRRGPEPQAAGCSGAGQDTVAPGFPRLLSK